MNRKATGGQIGRIRKLSILLFSATLRLTASALASLYLHAFSNRMWFLKWIQWHDLKTSSTGEIERLDLSGEIEMARVPPLHKRKKDRLLHRKRTGFWPVLS